MKKRKFWFSHNMLTIFALMLGVIAGFIDSPLVNAATLTISDITVRLMKLIAVPLLFLSIVSSAAHFSNFEQIKKIGTNIVKYTLFTTVLAALIAEALYLIFSPWLLKGTIAKVEELPASSYDLFDTLLTMIPDNLAGIFLENNVIAVVVIAIILAIAILGIKEREKEVVFSFFVGLLSALMRIVHVGLRFIPVAVFAFVAILTKQILGNETESLNAIGGLTVTVIAANLIQGFIVLPLLLRFKKINPLTLFLNVKEALILGFFTRSSMAALPVTLDHAIKDAKISPDIARLSLPLCTTINMNGCAQFILLSVYFVSAFTGNTLTFYDHIGMIFISVIAAVGNAGVPMGCFFLASSILASKDIPLYLMGSILPLYTLIDMVETAINIWSDVSITKIVDQNHSKP